MIPSQARLAAIVDDLDLLLVDVDDQLGLALRKDPAHPLTIPFFSRSFRYRIQHATSRNELLLKALGQHRGASLRIVDATAGLGRDAFLLASKGHHVVMCERSPILAAMLFCALQKLQTEPHEVKNRLTLHEGNAADYLQNAAIIEQKPDIVYLDPMFPIRTKTALVKKDMQILHQLLGMDRDVDAAELLTAARSCAARRVIVKRPKSAPFLADQAADFSYFGKNTRFDVYNSVINTRKKKAKT